MAIARPLSLEPKKELRSVVGAEDTSLAKEVPQKYVRAEYLAKCWSVHKSTIMRLRRRGILTGMRLGSDRIYLYDAQQAERELRAYFEVIAE